jgi:enterochelin esterase-like enzyme
VSIGLVVLAVLAGGVTGAIQYGVTFWLYRGFPAPKAPSTVLVVAPGRTRVVRVVPATTQRILVRASALKRWADPVYIVLPPGYAQHPWVHYPVLFLLHGFPGEPQTFITAGDLVPTYEVLLAEQRVQPMIIVVPSGSKHYLTDEEWANGVRAHSAWETFVARDLVATVDARYRTIPSGPARAIAGLSEGGYAALNIGFHHPNEFGVLESWSGYMKADDIPAIFGRRAELRRYNSPADQLPVVASSLRANHVSIWFYIGSDDPLVTENRHFAAELERLHISHQFQVLRGRGHSWALWRSMMTSSLVFASQHLDHG